MRFETGAGVNAGRKLAELSGGQNVLPSAGTLNLPEQPYGPEKDASAKGCEGRKMSQGSQSCLGSDAMKNHFVFQLALTAALMFGDSVARTDDEVLTNHFNDPFLQVTDAVPTCEKQVGPRISIAQMRAESRCRAERGTGCFRLYDAEIIPRVKQAILADGRFANTSIAVEGQRRWVWLRGCVASEAQIAALEQLVRNIDDVEAVIAQLKVVLGQKP
jgi:BON domain